MERGKLLIAEGSAELRQVMFDMFQGSFQIQCCADGYEAQKCIPRFRPDVMIVDVKLPGIDGISLLQWANGQGIRTRVLLTTRFPSEYILEAGSRVGVDYVMLKPLNFSALAARVEDMCQSMIPAVTESRDPDSQITGLLLALGFRPKLRGYACLREAILLCAGGGYDSVTKLLYPEVARRLGCRSSHVERNIRSAIESAWATRDEALWRLYFAPDSTGQVPRPTNAELIGRLAESLRARAAG